MTPKQQATADRRNARPYVVRYTDGSLVLYIPKPTKANMKVARQLIKSAYADTTTTALEG